MAASFAQDDFRRIGLSLAVALVMVTAGAGAVIATLQLIEAEKFNLNAAKGQRADIQGRLSRARDEEQEIRRMIVRFNELAERGVIGQERRLDWIERIHAIRSARKLFDIQYEIAPQMALDAAALPGSSVGFEFLASTMNARLKLLHEGDLLNFLDDLRASAPAHLLVRKCDVRRLPTGGGEGGRVSPKLGADCAIDWITIRERKVQ